MSDGLFLFTLAAGLAGVMAWAFRVLPKERWQILASVPARRHPSGWWTGVNLTYYGALSASAYFFALVLFLVLAGSLGVPRRASVAVLLGLVAICAPAARWMARLVEGKRHTLTVAGAVFVGLGAAPLAVLAVDRLLPAADLAAKVVPVVAAMAIAYVFGEGLGRLACISFGCCYGKPLAEVRPLTRRLFERLSFTFYGRTRKIAYASGLEGVPVVPIQALTATVHVAVGLAAIWLFLVERPAAALVAAMVGAHLWRLVSERLRADHRGGGRITAYQWMSLAALGYPFALIAAVPPSPAVAVDVAAGLATLWDPALILLLQLLWLALFLYTGWSMVTGSLMAFHVRSDRT